MLMSVVLAAAVAATTGPPAQTAVAGGVSIELSVQTLDGAQTLTEGRDVRLRVRLRDAETGAPLARSVPGAWLSPRDEGTCAAKAQAFLGDTLFGRPEADLNELLVVALNDDATITVLDPGGSFGGTHHLAAVELPARGGDWVLSPEGDRLFVSIPSLGRVVAIDTATWRNVAEADAGREANALALQPDGAFVWVSTAEGVTVLRARDLAVSGRPLRGAGPFAVAFSEDSRVAFVADGARGAVALFEGGTLKRRGVAATGVRPAAIAYSPLAQAACVVHADGSLATVDRRRGRVVARAATEPGATAIAFAPGARYAFVAHRERDRVHVFDIATGNVVRAMDVDGGPERIVFSDTLAYFQPSCGEFVNMTGIDGAAESQLWSFPIGRTPAVRTGLTATALAHAGGGTMFAAHPGEAVIYVYREGMAAPSAALRNDRRAPQAVLALQRGLRERQPGVYETAVRLPAAGPRDLTLFLPAAKTAQCFALDVLPDPRARSRPAAPGAVVSEASAPATATAGDRVRLKIRLVDPATREPLRDVEDVVLLVMRAPGVWFQRVTASMESPGTYGADVLPPVEGVYYVYVECPSRGVALGSMHAAAFVATAR